MKKIVVSILIIVVLAVAGFVVWLTVVQNNITGSGAYKTDSIELASGEVYSLEIKSLDTGGDFFGLGTNIVVEIKEEYSATELTVETDDNILERVSVSLKGNKIVVSGNWRDVYKTEKFIVKTGAKISDLKVEGAAAFTVDNLGAGDNFKLSASGSAEGEIVVKDGETVANVEINVSGSANVVLLGKAEGLTLKASGSAFLDAFDFEVNRAEISVSGSCEAEVNVSEALKISASGSAEITYMGDPAIEEHLSGSARIVPFD